jgi:serine/threonine protein kinase
MLVDGGTTEDGWPYLIMDYVEGQPIDRYVKKRDLPVAERLELFRMLCGAVHYAHQNLVVHRD